MCSNEITKKTMVVGQNRLRGPVLMLILILYGSPSKRSSGSHYRGFDHVTP